MTPPYDLMQRLALSAPLFVAETSIAHVWKVLRSDGTSAALKIYNDRDPKGEDVGFHLLKALDGAGMARIYHFDEGVALLEWLDGPTLGDLARGGQDAEVDAHVINVADAIHQAPRDVPLTPLAGQFKALMALQPDDGWPEALRQDMRHARDLAMYLLANQHEIRSLHGDLHHDNIIQGADWCKAIDPKGLMGDRAYDLANAFKNPVGAPQIFLDPTRADRLAKTWAAQWDTTPKRLLGWAVAHCALSITWAQAFDNPAETNALAMLSRLYKATA